MAYPGSILNLRTLEGARIERVDILGDREAVITVEGGRRWQIGTEAPAEIAVGEIDPVQPEPPAA